MGFELEFENGLTFITTISGFVNQNFQFLALLSWILKLEFKGTFTIKYCFLKQKKYIH